MDSEHIFMAVNGAIVLLLGIDRITMALGRLGKLPERWQRHFAERDVKIAQRIEREEALRMLASVVDPLLKSIEQQQRILEQVQAFQQYIERHDKHHEDLDDKVHNRLDAQVDIYTRLNRIESKVGREPTI